MSQSLDLPLHIRTLSSHLDELEDVYGLTYTTQLALEHLSLCEGDGIDRTLRVSLNLLFAAIQDMQGTVKTLESLHEEMEAEE